MNFEQNTYDDGTYLVYRLEENQKIDNFALNTIMNNKIDGVFKVNKENDNGREVFYINITSKIALNMLLDKPVRRDFVLNVLESMAKTSIDADEYLLDPKYFLFDYDNIFIDLSTQKVNMIYLPIERDEKEVNIKEFIRNFLFDLTYYTGEDCNYVARLINVVNSKDKVTMDKLVDVIGDIRKRIVKKPATPQPGRPAGQDNPNGTAIQNNVKNQSNNQWQGQQPLPQNNANVNQFNKPSSKMESGISIPGSQNIPSDGNDNKGEAKKFGFFKFGKNKPLTDDQAPPASMPPVEKEKKKGLFGGKGEEKKNAAQVPSSGLRIPGMDTPEPIIPVSEKQQNKQPVMPQQPPQAKTTPQSNSQQKSQPQAFVQQPPYPQNGANGGRLTPAESGTSSGTVILGGAAQSGKTVFKKAVESKGLPVVTRVSTNEAVAIQKTPFKLGKEKDFVDYYISGNATVSRLHAQIIQEDGHYFIVDSNSLNHTFLGNDTTPLQSGKAYPISSGMHFILSDEEFVFTIK